MDADIQIMVAGTVQTDCQVCDSVTVSFLTHGFRHLWLWSFLSPSNAERGAELLLGQSLPRMGVNFRLAGQGHIEPPNSEGEAGFAFSHTADRSFGVTLQPFV